MNCFTAFARWLASLTGHRWYTSCTRKGRGRAMAIRSAAVFGSLLTLTALFGSACATAGAQVPPGPTLAETKAWLEREVPAMGADEIDGTSPQGFHIRTKYETESVVLSDCRLTLRSAFQVEDTP